VTEQQWQVELVEALADTQWEIHWYGVIQQYPSCLADVFHRTSKTTRQIDLDRDLFRTPKTRKAEILRQLVGV
jgi:hypothetical protein